MRTFACLSAVSLLLIFATAWTAAGAPAETAGELAVLSADEKPAELLGAYLVKECDKLLDARREEVRSLETPEAVRERIERIRKSWSDALGPFPERGPLNGKTLGAIQAEGYRIERVLYESRPGHHVTGNLYVPAGKGPFPGVLVPCGHSANGKAEKAYQSICILLVRHGFVALIYDPIGQGERYQLIDDSGKPIAGGTGEHTLTDIGARLTGTGAANYRIWGIRSLDYLISRPRSTSADRLHGQLRRWDADGVPDGHRRPDSGRRPVVLHHLAQPAVQHDRPARRRAEHHGPSGAGDRPRRLRRAAGAQADADRDGHARLLRHRRLVGQFPGGQAAVWRPRVRRSRVDLFEYPDKHGFSQPRARLSCDSCGLVAGVDDAHEPPSR